MQITQEADYATRTILHLARACDGNLIATHEIARQQKIPPSFLAKIVSQLSTAGLLYTSRGARGGVRLSKSPKNITLLEVIEAIDGPIRLNVCTQKEGRCSLEGNCPLQRVWCMAQQALVKRLRNTNFAQLSASEPSMAIPGDGR